MTKKHHHPEGEEDYCVLHFLCNMLESIHSSLLCQWSRVEVDGRFFVWLWNSSSPTFAWKSNAGASVTLPKRVFLWHLGLAKGHRGMPQKASPREGGVLFCSVNGLIMVSRSWPSHAKAEGQPKTEGRNGRIGHQLAHTNNSAPKWWNVLKNETNVAQAGGLFRLISLRLSGALNRDKKQV